MLRVRRAATTIATTPASGSVGFSGKIQREIRIFNFRQFCTFPDERKCIVEINQRGLYSSKTNTEEYFPSVLMEEDEKELTILNDRTDGNLEMYSEYGEEPEDIMEDEDYDSDDENYLRAIADARGVEVLDLENTPNLLNNFFLMECLLGSGQLRLIYREAMLVEELTRVVPNTNRGLVEFVFSHYDPGTIMNERLITYDSDIPIKICRLIEFRRGSKLGIKYMPYKKLQLYPLPQDIMTCFMVMAYLGYDEICPERDFVTLSRYNKNYARVTFIPPTQITELEDDETLKASFSKLLTYLNNNYKNVNFAAEQEKILMSLCKPNHETSINVILRHMSMVNFEKYQLSKDVWRVIKKNAFITARVMTKWV